MAKEASKQRPTGYEKYINYKWFGLACFLFAVIVLLPIPDSMLDVGVEYSMGRTYSVDMITGELFGTSATEAEQWQILLARIVTENMTMGAISKDRALLRTLKWCEEKNIPVTEKHLIAVKDYLQQMTDEQYHTLATKARELMYDELSYEQLKDNEKQQATTQAHHLKVCIALAVFVVTLFLTEGLPLPGVAFCIGLILLFSGVLPKDLLPMAYWSDPCWFIMGSLMFAVAFVKTGVDKRICLAIFGRFARANPRWITLSLILVIAPAAAFISDHALAAIFLPIGILLYQRSLTKEIPIDPQLAKMLMITICMACNIGGFGAPSGGARNVVMMAYMEDMFGISIGYGQWITYCLPFVFIMMPITWLMINWRFKPAIKDLSPAMSGLKEEIKSMGPWSKSQITVLVIFLVVLFGWITDKTLVKAVLGFSVGIGGIAVGGAVAYLIAGVVNWKDYQTKVDWGVVWLYAGAIAFGRSLFSTGAAYWLARTIVDFLAQFGFGTGLWLCLTGNVITAFMTNLMADGPAAAAVGPITLNMAAIAAPASVLIPFTGLATAGAASMAYLLIIGTPPNAIVYASGYLEAKDYLKVGIPLFIIANLVLMFIVGVYWVSRGFAGYTMW